MEIPSDFCADCGALIDIPIYGDYIECHKCGARFDIAEYPIKPIESTIEFKDKKTW